MKAVMQNFRTGELAVAEVPAPLPRPGCVLVQNAASLISAGTEKAAIALARMSPLKKARTRPDLVRKVLNRVGQEGLLETARNVLNLVSAPIPLGYSCAGIVRAVGEGVTDLRIGDRVACAGYGYATHSEVVVVPRNLVVRVPDQVDFDAAAFVTVGAISVQGVRQADLQIGESVVVIGLGLLGQITAQLCRAAGASVFGLDLDAGKIELARRHGMDQGLAIAGNDDEIVAGVMSLTRGRGADAVIITAGTTSNHPIDLAPKLARDRARVVAVGDLPLNIPRWAYYAKEIDVRLSRSYGPGRYDPSYEEKGHDYPIGYVRWTENRNMESFLDLVATGRLDVGDLITHRFPVERALDAFGLLTARQAEPYLGIVLSYDPDLPQPTTVRLEPASAPAETGVGTAGPVRIGVIGAGQYAKGVLLPRLRRIGDARITAVATGTGATARAVAEKYGAELCSSDYHDVLRQETVDAVIVATRHHLHAPIVMEALAAGKDVLVEKPLAIHPAELDALVAARQEAIEAAGRAGRRPPAVFVGFNRRYAPAGLALRRLVVRLGAPAVIDYRINAGSMPADHWVHDPKVGGGRIVGEMCHAVDLVQFALGRAPTEVFCTGRRGERARRGGP